MSAPAIQPQTATWTIDASHSHVEFAVRHMMVATVKGTFNEVKGAVTYDGVSLAEASIDVEIPIASIDTRNVERDNHLKSADFFDAASHPSMTFKSTRIVSKGGNEFELVGDLTIRGTTRQVTLTAESNGALRDPWGMERAGFSAKGKINRFDYGLQWNAALETGGLVVGQDVKITLEVEIVRPAA
jgi:polyisoprenoid-binding protein YceI